MKHLPLLRAILSTMDDYARHARDWRIKNEDDFEEFEESLLADIIEHNE